MKKMFFSLMLAFGMMLIGTFAQAQQDIDKHASCKYCGMDRKMFAHSRMLLIYEDGSELGTCSLHCLAVDMALNIDKTPKSIQVADYNTKILIDAEKGRLGHRRGEAGGDVQARQVGVREESGCRSVHQAVQGDPGRFRDGHQDVLRGHVLRY